jgi:hypothetical protein
MSIDWMISSKGEGMDTSKHVKQAFTELAPSYSSTMDKELNQFWGISYPDFVEHLVMKAQVKPPRMLAEARRLLTSTGRLVISDVGATPYWRSPAGKLLIRLLMLEYGYVNQSSRSQAELEAFQNVRTAQEWSALLKHFGYVKVRVDEIKPRYPWYPSGLTLQAEIAS